MNQAAEAAAMPSSVPRLCSRSLIAIHLLPGVPTALAYGVLSALMVPRGLPNMLALMLAILFVEVPVMWTIIVRQVRRETGGRFTLRDAFPWRTSVPIWLYLVIGLPVIILSFVVIGALGPVMERIIQEGIFAWVPAWFVMRPAPNMFTTLSQSTLITLWAFGLIGMTIAGGLTQELYFRGFLLPRIAHLGGAAPVVNAALFAIFHLIAPWGWPTFFLASLPWAFLVYWRRSVKIGLFCHVGMLFIQWLMMPLLVWGIVSLPPGDRMMQAEESARDGPPGRVPAGAGRPTPSGSRPFPQRQDGMKLVVEQKGQPSLRIGASGTLDVAMKDQIEILKQGRKEWVARFTAGDMEGLGALLTDDVVWIPPHQAAVDGKAAILKWLQPFFLRYKYEFRTSGETIRIAGDWAVDRGSYVSRIIDKESGEAMSQDGGYVLLWRRERDGGWRIERYIDLPSD